MNRNDTVKPVENKFAKKKKKRPYSQIKGSR